MLLPLLAITLSLGCVIVAALHLRKLWRLELPTSAELLTRIDASLAPGASHGERKIELDEAVSEADRNTRGSHDVPAALVRIALAGGTALALGRLAMHPDVEHLAGAGVAFGAGIVAAMCVSYLGRMASERARRVRAHWSELSRRAHRELEP